MLAFILGLITAVLKSCGRKNVININYIYFGEHLNVLKAANVWTLV